MAVLSYRSSCLSSTGELSEKKHCTPEEKMCYGKPHNSKCRPSRCAHHDLVFCVVLKVYPAKRDGGLFVTRPTTRFSVWYLKVSPTK